MGHNWHTIHHRDVEIYEITLFESENYLNCPESKSLALMEKFEPTLFPF